MEADLAFETLWFFYNLDVEHNPRRQFTDYTVKLQLNYTIKRNFSEENIEEFVYKINF